MRTASGSVDRAPLLIDLLTDEGVVGHAYLFGYQPFTLAPLRDLVVSLGETVNVSRWPPWSSIARCAPSSRCSVPGDC